jgi:hypothetical protein
MDLEKIETFYHGKKWDAPFMDDAFLMPDQMWRFLLSDDTGFVVNKTCAFCGEELVFEDNAFMAPSFRQSHTECYIRSGMGDVAHLEGRCICSGEDRRTTEETNQTFREEALATVQWMLDHGRGRWLDTTETRDT